MKPLNNQVKSAKMCPFSRLRRSKKLARLIHCKKAPVIFERRERPALYLTIFCSEKELRMSGRFFASLKKDGYQSARG